MNSNAPRPAPAARDHTNAEPGLPGGTGHWLSQLAGWCYDHRRLVLAIWAVAVIGVITAAVTVGGSFSNSFSGGNSESQSAQNLIDARFPGQSGDTADVVLHSATPLTSAANAARISALTSGLRPLAKVSEVTSPLSAASHGQLSPDRRTGFIVVQFSAVAADLPNAAVGRVVTVAQSHARPGFTVAVGGAPIENVVTAAPGASEGFGITAAVIIMLLAFGSVVAMGLPIVTALAGVGLGFGVVDAASHLLTVPTFGPELMAMIGLGVGIDYALFIVTSFRSELADGRDPRAAVMHALGTAGRAVLFAGCTVVIALLGLYVVDLPFMTGLATGTILAVLLVLAGALTLLPALLGFAGRSIDRLHIPGLLHRKPGRRGFWVRWSETVQRRPAICGLAALAVLVVLAIPMLSMRLAFSDAGNDPPSLTTRQAYDLLAEGFGPGFNGPLIVAATVPSGQASAVGALDRRIKAEAGVAAVSPPQFDASKDAALIVVYPTTAPQAAQTATLVTRLRGSVIPAGTRGTGITAYVGGQTAAGADAASFLSARLPWVIALVIGLAFLLLLAVFRSVLIPVKAALMNLLSIGAAYGVIVAVYQWGWLSAVFGVSRTSPVDPWIPMMMFTIVFGLSMDYEVFLLSRIQAEWLRTGDNSAAVTNGLASSARVITAAAAIMVCVFGSFVVNDPLHILNVFGLGLATAIFVDATIVRMVLVPSVMQLLGSANWWWPGRRALRPQPQADPARVGSGG